MTVPRLRGRIDVFDPATQIGVIGGADGARYYFGVDSLETPAPLTVGQDAVFGASDDGRARRIKAIESIGAFDLGRVVQRTFRSLGRHWVLPICAAMVLVGLPRAIAGWGAQNMSGGQAVAATSAFWLGALTAQLGSYVLIGLIAGAVINDIRGRPTDVRESLRTSARVALPLAGLGVLCTLGIVVGALFLLIPALIFSLWWSVAGPILVIERRGITECMHRSIELTANYRLRIFGLFMAYGILSWILRFAVTYALTAMFASVIEDGSATVAVMVAEAAINVVGALVWATGGTALYYELRTVKEGDEPDHLAAVFD